MSDDPYKVPTQLPIPPTPQHDPLIFRIIGWTFMAALVVVPVFLVLAEMLLTPTVGTDPNSNFEEVQITAPVDQEVQSGDMPATD